MTHIKADAEKIIVCMPVDTSELEKLAPGVRMPKPYVNAVEGECGRCKKAVWLGPIQHAYHELEPMIPVVCPLCLLAETCAAGETYMTVQLNPDDGPRRG